MRDGASKTVIRNWEKQADSSAIFNLCLFCSWTTVPPFGPLYGLSRNGLVDFGQNLLDLASLELVGHEESESYNPRHCCLQIALESQSRLQVHSLSSIGNDA